MAKNIKKINDIENTKAKSISTDDNADDKIISEAQIMNERLLHADTNFSYKSFASEKSLYNIVANGDIDALEARKPSLQRKGLGTLSTDMVRNIRYHMVINTANCARICIENGMDTETAYTISDLYIRKADEASSIEKIEKINYQMIFDYTIRMKEMRDVITGYPTEIRAALQYIDSNLHKQLRASDVATFLDINISTFSQKFLYCTGQKFNPYVEDRRLQLAKRYLRFTDLQLSEIAANLAYCSQSYFNARFKEYTGMTPLQYRKATENDI